MQLGVKNTRPNPVHRWACCNVQAQQHTEYTDRHRALRGTTNPTACTATSRADQPPAAPTDACMHMCLHVIAVAWTRMPCATTQPTRPQGSAGRAAAHRQEEAVDSRRETTTTMQPTDTCMRTCRERHPPQVAPCTYSHASQHGGSASGTNQWQHYKSTAANGVAHSIWTVASNCAPTPLALQPLAALGRVQRPAASQVLAWYGARLHGETHAHAPYMAWLCDCMAKEA